MKQPRILFVDHTAVMGGAELSLFDLATAYASTSQVLLFEDGPLHKRLKHSGVNANIVEASTAMLSLRTSSGLSSLATIPELWQLADKIKRLASGCDLILANSQKAFVVTALSALQGSPPVYWYLHDILTAKHFSKINRAIAVLLANRFATKVLVNSEATGKAFVAAGGNPKLYRVVYNGFDSNKFDTIDSKDINMTRARLGISNAPLVGLFSRLSYWKGQHVLLEAVRQLPEVQVILVGEALFGEEEYVSQLKQLAKAPELASRIHWLGFRDDVPTLMKACDLILHTSTEPEPFGRVIVEGQLAQRPVIASAAGGALELIENGKNGYLFPPEDAIALRQLIDKLLGNPDLAKSIASQGYEDAKANFSLKTILQSFAEAIALPKN